LNEPICVFWVATFFIGGLLNELGVFRVGSFFIGGLLNEPMNEGSDSAPLFMAPIFCVKCLSNFQLRLLAVSTLL
jgi:hypothetical protein